MMPYPDVVAGDLDLEWCSPVNGVVAQKMRVGLDRPKVVYYDHLDTGAAPLYDGAQHVAANSAESVDRHLDRH